MKPKRTVTEMKDYEQPASIMMPNYSRLSWDNNSKFVTSGHFIPNRLRHTMNDIMKQIKPTKSIEEVHSLEPSRPNTPWVTEDYKPIVLNKFQCLVEPTQISISESS